MRNSFLLFLLTVSTMGLLTTVAAPQAAAQAPNDPDDEPFIPAKLDKLTLTLNPGGHTALIEKVFFTPDSKQLISLGWDHGIRIWDVETGAPVKTLYPPGYGPLEAAALSPDGKRLAVASIYPEKDTHRYLIYLLALPEGRVERVLKGSTQRVNSLAFSGDGKRLASCATSVAKKPPDSAIHIWDPDRDEPVQVLKRKAKGENLTMAVALSRDGSRLAALGQGTVGRGVILDLATRAEVGAFEGTPKTGVAYSPDGKTLVTRSGKTFQLREENGQLRSQHDRYALWTSFSKDSQKVLVAFGGKGGRLSAALMDVATGKDLSTFHFPTIAVANAGRAGALSPDGKYAATAGGGGGTASGVASHAIVLWKMEDGTIHKRLEAASWIARNSRVAWSADGKAVCWDESPKKPSPSFHLGQLQIGPAIPEQEARAAVWKQDDLALEPDGFRDVKVLKAGTSVTRLTLALPNLATLIGKDRAALASTKAHQFALFDLHTGKVLRRFTGFGPGLTSIAPAPNGRFLVSISLRDQTLRLWSLERDQPLLSLYVQGQDWVIWTPEGYYAATPGGERLMGWTVDHGMDKMPSYYPVARFRKTLYRPDLIKKVFELGSVEKALKALDGDKAKPADLEQLLPPKCTLKILKDDGQKVTVRVEAEAQVQNQPVVAVRLLLDGRPLPEGAGLKEFAQGQPLAAAAFTLDLPAGKHSLSVLARSEDASALSESISIHRVNAAQQPVLHLLAIGIDKYGNGIPNLNCAVNDARDLVKAFPLARQGNLFRDVKTHELIDGQATAPAIRARLRDVTQGLKREDVLVVFFAGHGVKEGKDFFLLTAEANPTNLENTALSGKELSRLFRDLPCSQVLLLLDACHSGAVVKNLRPATDDAVRTFADDEVGVTVLAAARGHQKAFEKGGNGYFTTAIKEALAGAEDVPRHPRDQRLYVDHLYSHVLHAVAERSSQRQHPFLSLPSSGEPFALRQFAQQRK